MSSKGSSPQSDLDERKCVTCGTLFQPYRASSVACSRTCYRLQPHVREMLNRGKQRPEVRERKNVARRIANNPDRVLINLRNNLQRHGVTVEQYEAMLDRQLGCCAICGTSPTPGGSGPLSRLHVDHDHITGRVRALLCTRCNPGVGFFQDDPALLRRAAEYIERHRT